MIHSCIGLEFLSERELYVLTAHKEDDDFESRIFMYDIESGEIDLIFIFENWIKRFKIIEKETVWASQWDDSIYRLSLEKEDHFHLTVPCITDFKVLPDQSVLAIGFGGNIARIDPSGRTKSVASPTREDLLYCLPKDGVFSICGANGVYMELDPDFTSRSVDLQTNCFLTSMAASPDGRLLISGRGVLIQKSGDSAIVLSEGQDFYDGLWRKDSFLVCAGTDGVVQVSDEGLVQTTDIPSYCIAQTARNLAVGGLDAFTVFRDGRADTVRLAGEVLDILQI